MNQRMLAALSIGWVAPAAGCVIETSDRDHGSDRGAWITADWSLVNMSDGAQTACPRGFDTAELVVLPVDDTGAAIGDPVSDLFDCDDFAGISTSLFPGLYAVWIEVRSHDLSALYAQSLSQFVDVRRADQRVSIDVLNDGGYFQLSWDLIGGTTNRPLDCTDIAGLDSLAMVSANVADAKFVYDDSFRCEDHAAISGGLLQGAYTISIDAIAHGASLGGVTSTSAQTIYSQNRVTDLGSLLIPIDGL